ncbi:methyltransferase domain-containing protein [Paenibacillus sp. MER 99-2]|uniref:class I SAM-dependent methyltransferase n=1 Tax=Paenibacillus sp. MER 99-2 TaxID=2939572 RepID=UPI002041F43E|nr:methyltransferase domain-containing protein [Paenibacillus sp. MER 99-2]MCM3175854.1 methyltransferase domain-containing protein [Paenibacillus sp. MER 99-2]
MKTPEPLLFLQGFLKNPKRVGSVLPTSKFLAHKIVQSVRWDEIRTIAELGPGTGAITRLMREQLPQSATVFLFERDPKMRSNLKKTYPEFMFHSNASYLLKRIQQENVHQLDWIICGLPFFNFSREMRQNILSQIHTALRPGGMFVLYQYSLHMKKRLAELFEIEKIQFEPFSFPPVFVYICRKKDEEGHSETRESGET